MDSLTLLIVLNVLIGLSLIFSIVIAGRRDSAVSREWIASYLFLFAGFFLLLFQGSLPPLVSIVIANLFIVLGFYFQVPAALNLEYGNRLSSRYPLLLILPVFGFLFLIYTYLDFNTSMRIVFISAFLGPPWGFSISSRSPPVSICSG